MADNSRANRDLNLVYPDIRTRFYRLAQDMKDHFKPVFLVEGFRTAERQKWINEQNEKVIAALPGNSWHQYGLALDIAFLDGNPFGSYHPWLDLRRLAIAHGFEAISRIDSNNEVQGDKDHFQLRYGFSMDEIKALYEYNGIEAVWAKIDLKRGLTPGEGWMGPQL